MIQFLCADLNFKWENKLLMKRWLKEVIASFGFKCGDIQVVACSDAYLLKMNQQFLDHDYYTDIITFDNSEGNVMHGDLLISIDRVKDNALSFQVDYEQELLRVVVHGVLHLAGLRDKSKKDQKVMREAENDALKLFNSLKIK